MKQQYNKLQFIKDKQIKETTNNNNQKTRKYIKFTIVFYEFSYFETVT